MANSNFYDTLDLKYPEIAVCIDKIDRINPGTKNFYIPILTPNLDTTSLKTTTETVHQTNAIIDNDQKIKISNVKIQNYIPITIPKELCSISDGEFVVENIENIGLKTNNGSIKITGSTGSGGAGDYSHSHSTLSGNGSMTFDGSAITFKGSLKITPTDKYRYIEAGSKWIVVFIGGDINKPQIIGRYIDQE